MSSASRPTAGPALGLLVLRLGLVAGATTIVWWAVAMADAGAAYPPSPLLASLALLPVNALCLWLVRRWVRAQGLSLREYLGIRSGRALVADSLWGLLWIMVLYLPFAAAVVGTMWVLHGDDTFTAFQTVFFDPDAAGVRDPVWALALGVVAVLTFAPLNAPAEEAVYRGLAQSRLTAAWSAPAAVAASAVAFGLQHAFFAPTTDAMIVYIVAFTVWGVGSGIIVLRQRRLMPIVIAHFVVNVATSSPAVVFPILQLAGVVPA